MDKLILKYGSVESRSEGTSFVYIPNFRKIGDELLSEIIDLNTDDFSFDFIIKNIKEYGEEFDSDIELDTDYDNFVDSFVETMNTIHRKILNMEYSETFTVKVKHYETETTLIEFEIEGRFGFVDIT